MTPERWQQVKEILHGALQKEPGQRSAYLNQVCQTDHSLQRDVESLLASGPGGAEDFLKSAPPDRFGKGARLGPYEIISLLGAGGMGEVYRARDSRLGRDVALKVIPVSYSSDPVRRQRFQREARAISALQHPNICTLYDVGQQDGADYLVMEYLEGETLSSRLAMGALKVEQILTYGIEIAGALDAAHKQSIIHRDLKPANILITSRGECKVLDFGLAKLEMDEDAARTVTDPNLLSSPGVPMGTVPYMSPEQARGEELDARSDVFSLGSVLYEMATGKMAFTGKSSAIIFKAILDWTPPSPSELNHSLPHRLDNVIAKCLEKDRELRYQSASQLGSDLQCLRRNFEAPVGVSAHPTFWQKHWLACFAVILVALVLVLLFATHWGERLLGARDPKIRSLAVLPLENLSGDREQEYFADGMTDELTTDLSKIAALQVISRTSAMHYKGTNKTVPEIARELHVDGVVEGSVMRSGSRVRVTAQLINANTDQHVWAESYERDLQDILLLQKEVAHAVADEVRVKLSPQDESNLTATKRTNSRAYDAYLRGRYLWNQRNADSIAKAVGYFHQAVQEDPDYALGYSGLADCYWVGWGAKTDLLLAEQYARKAVSLGPNIAEAHASLGFVLFREHRMSNVENELRRAFELNPNYAIVHHYYAVYLLSIGRLKDALKESDRALQLDPFSIPINNMRSMILIDLREYEGAIEQVNRLSEIVPESSLPHKARARIYWLQGRAPEAITEQEKAASLDHNEQWLDDQELIAQVYKKFGVRAASIKTAQSLEAHLVDSDDMWIAFAYGDAEDRDKTFEHLELSLQRNNGNLQYCLKTAPEFDFLRNDPRYLRLLHELEL